MAQNASSIFHGALFSHFACSKGWRIFCGVGKTKNALPQNLILLKTSKVRRFFNISGSNSPRLAAIILGLPWLLPRGLLRVGSLPKSFVKIVNNVPSCPWCSQITTRYHKFIVFWNQLICFYLIIDFAVIYWIYWTDSKWERVVDKGQLGYKLLLKKFRKVAITH